MNSNVIIFIKMLCNDDYTTIPNVLVIIKMFIKHHQENRINQRQNRNRCYNIKMFLHIGYS